MKKVTFRLQIYCTVGWDDNEDIGTLEVDSFSQVLEVASVLKKFHSVRPQNDKAIVEEYKNIRDEMESDSGDEIMSVGEVIGIQCLYEDDRGVQVEMSLSDNFGVDGSAKVNGAEHENEYKRLLAESKKLATEILKL